MIEYRKTLNLPKTAFPMKASLSQREPETLEFWDRLNLYQRLREQSQGQPKFIIHDGPPYANGPIHLGTSLNKILKDIVVKSKTLSGYDAPYVPGWDCHGLPIELKVEKKVGKPGRKIAPADFRHVCQDFAKSQVALQLKDFQRLGVIADWAHPYLTMDSTYEANTVRALAQMIDRGYLHRGYKPVHWCPECGSALAEAEVEYKDKDSAAIDVAFVVLDLQKLMQLFDCKEDISRVVVPIWTTTPWTLPANQAVSLHPDFDYVLVSAKLANSMQSLIVAKDLLNEVMARYGSIDYRILATVKGAHLEHLSLQHPFIDRSVPIILGDHVTIDAGTGNVHTAPAHGQDDYLVATSYHLPLENPVDGRCCFDQDVPLVGGLHVNKANDPIVETLAKTGHLLHLDKIHHSYPHCWRHKTPLIFRATPQWFISIDHNGLREMALQVVADEVNWIPPWGRNRIYSMLESRPDWCISRQRFWGTPIPLFVHQETQDLHPNTVKLMATVADFIEERGIEAWFSAKADDFIEKDAQNYEKVTDILDVWFDSGVSHACVLEQRPELSVPADLYLEGSDQHRGWFQTSLLTSLAIGHAAPYKTILTHGYVVDGKGHKMSKSLGNTVLPSQVVKKYGADILRLWVASADFLGDINFSDEILKRVTDSYRRIRNTARFLLSNLYDFNPDLDKVAVDQLLALDFWAIQTAERLQRHIITEYDHYRFQPVCQLIHHFCSVEMGSFYLDLIKDRQYTSSAAGLPRRSSQTALYYILEFLVRWLAPVLSFTAEEIWRHMPGKREDSVFLSGWFKGFPDLKGRDDGIDWLHLITIRDAVNKQLEHHRGTGDIGSSLDAAVLLHANRKDYEALSALEDELRFLLITSEASVLSQDTPSDDLLIKVTPSVHEKCERCWQRCSDVGSSSTHPTICQRCIDNVFGAGEQRRYV